MENIFLAPQEYGHKRRNSVTTLHAGSNHENPPFTGEPGVRSSHLYFPHLPDFSFAWATKQANADQGPSKTRTHCGCSIVSCDVARPWQNVATLGPFLRGKNKNKPWLIFPRISGPIVARRANTRMFLKVFRNIFLCVRHKCCARGNTSQHLENVITPAIGRFIRGKISRGLHNPRLM